MARENRNMFENMNVNEEIEYDNHSIHGRLNRGDRVGWTLDSTRNESSTNYYEKRMKVRHVFTERGNAVMRYLPSLNDSVSLTHVHLCELSDQICCGISDGHSVQLLT